MGEYAKYNAENVLNKVNECIAELEATNKLASWEVDYKRFKRRGYTEKTTTLFKMNAVFEELSIFDWWNDTLSISQLKQMKDFLEKSIQLGFTGYVCFKVGATGCSHGMWAHKKESTDGYSPDGDCIFHSFRSGDCYWGGRFNGEWIGNHDKYEFTLKEIKSLIA